MSTIRVSVSTVLARLVVAVLLTLVAAPAAAQVRYDELANAEARLEHTYQHFLGREATTRETFVDPVGWQAWRASYLAFRAQGDGHELAIRKVENEIAWLTGQPLRWVYDLVFVVLDDAGFPVGARVTADPDTGSGRERVTDGSGFVHFGALPGRYTVRIEAEGRAPWVQQIDATLGSTSITVRLPAPRPPHRQIRGQLRVQGSAYADDDGPLPVLFAHFGEAFSAYVRRPDAVRRQLDAIRDAGYMGIRFWDVLGYYDSAWFGKEVTPIAFTNRAGGRVSATSDYYVRLAAFLRDVDARGLKVHHSRGDQNAWSRADKREHIRKVAEVYRSVGPHIAAIFEVSNESYQNGVADPAEAAELLSVFKSVHGQVLGGLSAPDGEEGPDLRTWSRDPADVVMVHGHRTGGFWDRIRHIISLILEGRSFFGDKPIWQGEPAGPGGGVTVGQENDPEALGLMAAMALATGQAWNYMCSPCVFWDSPIEAQPGFAEAAHVAKLLPPDVGQYGTVVHGGRANAVLTSPTGFPNHGRVDQVFSESRGKLVAIVYAGDGEVQARRHVKGQVCDVVPNRDGCYPFELGAGQRMKLRYTHGRLILADLAN